MMSMLCMRAEANLYDGNDDTFVWYDPDGDGNTTGDDFLVDDYIWILADMTIIQEQLQAKIR